MNKGIQFHYFSLLLVTQDRIVEFTYTVYNLINIKSAISLPQVFARGGLLSNNWQTMSIFLYLSIDRSLLFCYFACVTF